MGFIQVRKSSKGITSYQARVCRVGHPHLSKTFPTREMATAWIQAIEAEPASHKAKTLSAALQNLPTADSLDAPFASLLERHRAYIVEEKGENDPEAIRLTAMMRWEIASYELRDLKSPIIATWRDKRLRKVKAGTVIREINMMSNIINIARIEWGIPIEKNPFSLIRKPKNDPGRTRLLSKSEEVTILSAADDSQGGFLQSVMTLALETAMRQSEIISLDWQYVYFKKRYLHLTRTKNGEQRGVPLSRKAIALLESLAIIELTPDRRGPVFPGVTAEAVKRAFKNACKRAGIENLRFHDLRHEAISRFFEMGLDAMEVASISGHKDLRMLKRYTHLDATKLADKLG
jgi:integrase